QSTKDLEQLPFAPSDFVVYSIFEWQDRKNRKGTIKAFLSAFPGPSDAVLMLKINPGAAAAAQHMLDEVRAATGAAGPVRLCCETWSEARIQALHERGDCYVSLHKGEGWAYPLFEAAVRGKSIVATDYAGPRDYLDGQRHWLVRNSSAPVRQRYQFYQPSMNWAEPDIAHAAEGLRSIYERRGDVSDARKDLARQLADKFSIDQVGLMAKARLLDLLSRTNPPKAAFLRRQVGSKLRPCGLPIPGDWYDAAYFEHGLKSNWDRGYAWSSFKGVFEDMAGYLAEI